MSFKRSKNSTMVNPKPINVVAVRTHAIIVISSANRVLSHAKWLATDSLIGNRSAGEVGPSIKTPRSRRPVGRVTFLARAEIDLEVQQQPVIAPIQAGVEPSILDGAEVHRHA